MSADEFFLNDIAKNIDLMGGLSYQHRREIKDILKNSQLKKHDKASKIKWILEREGHGR